MLRMFRPILAAVLLCVGIIGGCQELTKADGTKTQVLTTQAVDTVKTAQSVSNAVEQASPPGTGLHEVAWLITSITGAILGINELRGKSDAGSLASHVRDLTAALVQAGLIKPPPPPSNDAAIASAVNQASQPTVWQPAH